MLKYKLSQIDTISKKIISNLSNTDCIFLFGELGSGKTTFARSFINQLQEKNKVKKTEVLSPTFNLLYE
jgi:Predicted ATPase or kinase